MEVENPLDRSESILRTDLLPGLLKAVKFNVDRQAEEVALFEIGHVFGLPSAPAVTPEETELLAVIVSPAAGTLADGTSASAGSADGQRGRTAGIAPGGRGEAAAPASQVGRASRVGRASQVGRAGQVRRAWARRRRGGGAHVALPGGRPALQGPTMLPGRVPGLHPTRAARLAGAGGQLLGAVGEVDPGVVEAYGLRQRLGFLSLSVDALLSEPRRPAQAREVSRFPASDVDLAFVVDERVPAAALHATLAGAGGDLLEHVWLFDAYRSAQLGPGRRSLAFRLRFRAHDRTLADTDLAAVRQRAIDAVVAGHGAELRA